MAASQAGAAVRPVRVAGIRRAATTIRLMLAIVESAGSRSTGKMVNRSRGPSGGVTADRAGSYVPGIQHERIAGAPL